MDVLERHRTGGMQICISVMHQRSWAVRAGTHTCSCPEMGHMVVFYGNFETVMWKNMQTLLLFLTSRRGAKNFIFTFVIAFSVKLWHHHKQQYQQRSLNWASGLPATLHFKLHLCSRLYETLSFPAGRQKNFSSITASLDGFRTRCQTRGPRANRVISGGPLRSSRSSQEDQGKISAAHVEIHSFSTRTWNLMTKELEFWKRFSKIHDLTAKSPIKVTKISSFAT